MNICFVITTLTGGGAERVASILCSEWAKTGNNVSVILTSKKNNANYYSLVGARIYELSPNKKISLFKKIKLVRNIFIKTNADVAVSFFPNSSFIAQKAMKGLKMLSFVSERNDPTHKKGFIQNVLKRITFKRADGVVFQTENVKKMFSNSIQKKSIIISNPLYPISVNAETNSGNSKIIVAVGRLVEQKRYPYLIEAFNYFKKTKSNYRLKIYGSGPDELLIKEMIKNYNLSDSIELLKFTNEIIDKINECDFFVMPSLFEGFPNALMEAVVLKKPCVVSDFKSGSARYLVQNNFSGIIVDTKSPASFFGEQMVKLADNIDFYKKGAIKQSDIILIKNNASSIASQWIDFFEKKRNEKQ